MAQRDADFMAEFVTARYGHEVVQSTALAGADAPNVDVPTLLDAKSEERLRAALEVLVPGKSGAAFAFVRDALELAKRSLKGEPLVALWNDQDRIMVGVVEKKDIQTLRDGLFRMQSMTAQSQDRHLLLGYEDGRLGRSDVAAMRFLGKSGTDVDDPVHLLDGIKVNPEEHALGRREAVDGAALARAVIDAAEGRAPGDLKLPKGSATLNAEALGTELEKAMRTLQDYQRQQDDMRAMQAQQDATQQTLRNQRMAMGQAIVSQALGALAVANNNVQSIRSGGPAAVRVDLGIASVRADGVVGQVLQFLGEPTNLQVANGTAAVAQAQLGYGMSLARG